MTNTLTRLLTGATLCALGVAVAGCGAASPVGAPSAGSSGIVGRTMVDGGCPVIRAGVPCPSKPVVATVEVTARVAGSTVLARTVSDASGRFRVDLPPGRYLVTAHAETAVFPTPPPRETVRVGPGSHTRLVLAFDSGIR